MRSAPQQKRQSPRGRKKPGAGPVSTTDACGSSARCFHIRARCSHPGRWCPRCLHPSREPLRGPGRTGVGRETPRWAPPAAWLGPRPGGLRACRPPRGERTGSRSSLASPMGTRSPGPRGACSKHPRSLLSPVQARPGWELGPQPSGLNSSQLSEHTCPGAQLRASQGGPSRPPHSPEALGSLPTAAAHPPNARHPWLRTSVRQVPS